jgi:hypothetical protein
VLVSPAIRAQGPTATATAPSRATRRRRLHGCRREWLGVRRRSVLYGNDTCTGGTCSTHAGDPCSGPDGDANCSESCNEGRRRLHGCRHGRLGLRRRLVLQRARHVAPAALARSTRAIRVRDPTATATARSRATRRPTTARPPTLTVRRATTARSVTVPTLAPVALARSTRAIRAQDPTAMATARSRATKSWTTVRLPTRTARPATTACSAMVPIRAPVGTCSVNAGDPCSGT